MSARWLPAAIAVAACSGAGRPEPAPPAPPPESPAGIDRAVIVAEVDTFIALVERACACTDTPCLKEVDDDLAEYERVATMNDPVTDLETWPSDLESLGGWAGFRLLACMLEHDYTPMSFTVGLVRKITAFRDAACSCTDVSCARRVEAALEKYVEEDVKDNTLPVSPEGLEQIKVSSRETRVCLTDVFKEQAMLDLLKLRKAACACEDAGCAGDARGALLAWGEEWKELTVPPAELERMTAVATEIAACITDAEAGN